MRRQTFCPSKPKGFDETILCYLLLIFLIIQSGYSQTTNAQSNEQPIQLELGKLIERDLAGERKHIYKIVFAANQYAKIIVEQRGIDAVAKLFDANGKSVLEYDSEARHEAEEIIEFAADAAGDYRLEIEAKYKLLPAGNYKIRFAELRLADDKDKSLQQARQLHDEALNLRRAGKAAGAIPTASRALELREKNLDPEHPDLAASLNLLGNLSSDTGDFEKAESFYNRALAIRIKIFGETNPHTAATFSDLGVVYRLQGAPDRAEPLYRRALAIREKMWGRNHPEVARTLNNLGNLALDNGDFIGAEAIYLQALAIREKTLEPTHSTIALTFNNLALIYGELGDYVKAETMYLRGLKIDEKNLPPEHPTIALYLDNLAGIYRDMGDLTRAEPMMKRALLIRENALGPDDLLVSASLNNIGNLYDDQGDYAQAEKAYSRSLEIREKKFKGNPHPWIAQSLYNLGDSSRKAGDLIKAETFMQRALAVSEKVFGANHPDSTYSLVGLANVYREMGNFEKAEPLYLRVISIYDQTFGAEHPMKAKILSALAMLYLGKNDLPAAIATQGKANAIAEKNAALNLTLGSEQKKLVYLKTLSEMFDRTLTISFYAKDKREANEIALTNVLQRKGRVLDAMSDTLSVLRRRFNPEDQSLLDKFNESSAKLALLVLNEPKRVTLAEHQRQINSLEEKRDDLEVEISRRAAGFYDGSKPVTLASVRQHIPENAVLIEFAVYQPILPKQKASASIEPLRYVAYLAGREGEVRMKDLGAAGDIEAAVIAFRKALFNPKRQDVRQLARTVDEKVMKPIRALVADKKQILISPDGALNLIPFEALVDEQNRYLVENYSFNYLTSGRDLLRMQVARESKSKFFVVANPLFGEPASTEIASNANSNARKNKRRSVTATRSLSDTYFAPLGGTIREARVIQSVFPESVFLDAAEATETALKETIAPRLLHIATHGFFLQNNDLSKNAIAKIENPLLRSGLALAGANRRDGEKDDGVLTALEASGLNLWGTKLVVLSACDTGLGEVRNGEGVYGLRRAFVLAGSESLMMSLWSVSDYVTRELMTNYYKNLKAGMGRGAALRQVQLEMLKRKDREHPFYWAAFIQSGEWANLDGRR